jgi:hypothetical protein
MNTSNIDIGRTAQAYGWSLISCHIVVWVFLWNTRLLAASTSQVEALCWPYFENCWQWRLPSLAVAQLFLVVYLTAILVAAAALWHGRQRLFHLLLIVTNLVLFALMSLDYRLRANEFYMLFWIQGVSVAFRYNRWAIPIAIVACYLGAGLLKLNTEWLSGAVLYAPLWGIPPGWTPAACAYVVLLELVGIWGLLARQWRWQALALGQLVLFHLQSLSQIHWFYPALMACILSWFVLDRIWGTDEGRPDLGQLFRGRAPIKAYALLAGFLALQFVPALYRGDSTLTGQGRVFALHMFEARQQCEVIATPATPGAAPRSLKLDHLSPRMVCDPLVYFNRAQNLCRTERGADPAFDLHLMMRARRKTDPSFTTIIDEPNFCSGQHEYVLFGNNRWLQAAWVR